MSKKIHVGVICGGQSAEHEVSLLSARNIIAALSPEKYEVITIKISREGKWYFIEDRTSDLAAGKGEELLLSPGNTEGQFALAHSRKRLPFIDVTFPVLHGPMGEDGTIQGLLKLLHIPFVGPGVLGSAIAMDKQITKRLLKEAGLPIGDYRVIHKKDREAASYENLSQALGPIMFVKPANLGSSVGIHKVTNEKEFEGAINDAFSYDDKVLCEASISGREIECSVMGNDVKQASQLGEIIVKSAFYSYEAKYLDSEAASLSIPAALDPEIAERIRNLAIHACETLSCEGMSRVDFFLTPENKIIINEINTIPGFTNSSMYPKLWAAEGMDMSVLVERLIELALERDEFYSPK